MRSDDFKAARKELGWSKARMARELGLGEKTVRRIEAGDTPASRAVDIALTALVCGMPRWSKVQDGVRAMETGLNVKTD